jgi:hypothetical protein
MVSGKYGPWFERPAVQRAYTDGINGDTVWIHALGADPVNPTTGEPGSPTANYTEFETFKLVRPRADA